MRPLLRMIECFSMIASDRELSLPPLDVFILVGGMRPSGARAMKPVPLNQFHSPVVAWMKVEERNSSILACRDSTTLF